MVFYPIRSDSKAFDPILCDSPEFWLGLRPNGAMTAVILAKVIYVERTGLTNPHLTGRYWNIRRVELCALTLS